MSLKILAAARFIRWMAVEDVVGMVTLGALVASVIWLWWNNRRLREAVARGEVADFSPTSIANYLYAEYLRGVLHVRALGAAAKLPPPLVDPLPNALNKYICVEVAAGR